MPLDHIILPVPASQFEAQVTWFTTALAPLGITEMARVADMVTGLGDTKPFFWITGIDSTYQPIQVFGGDDAAAGSDKESQGPKSSPFPDKIGIHIAFAANDTKQVDEFHAAALKAGGVSNGPPGIRAQYHPQYYAAFVKDLCGNNIEAVVHQCPELVKKLEAEKEKEKE